MTGTDWVAANLSSTFLAESPRPAFRHCSPRVFKSTLARKQTRMWALGLSSFWRQIGQSRRSFLQMQEADSVSLNWMSVFHESSPLKSLSFVRT